MKCEPCNHLLDGASAYRIKHYPVGKQSSPAPALPLNCVQTHTSRYQSRFFFILQMYIMLPLTWKQECSLYVLLLDITAALVMISWPVFLGHH